MKLVSTLALAAAAVAAGVGAQSALAAPPAQPAPAAPARKYNISKEAQKPLQDLQAAAKAHDEAKYAASLTAAQAVVKSNDEKYFLAQIMLQHAVDAKDQAAQLAALQAMQASGALDATQAAVVTRNIGLLATAMNNWALAEGPLTETIAANPGDLDMTVNLARTKIELKKNAEALPLLQRAIQLSNASGKPAPEGWYKNALQIALQTKNSAAVADLTAGLLKAYPGKENFNTALAVYASSGGLPADSELDFLRLKRASRTATAREYVYLASVADQAGLPGEVKGAIEEGRSAGVITGNDGAQLLTSSNARIAADRASLPADEAKARAGTNGRLALNTGNAYYGYGDYAKAADMYRLAVQKGGADPALANLRLGEALALAGQRAEAEAAFRAVQGPRAQLANLWMTWLAMPR